VTITDRLKDKDPEVRAKAASDLAVAAAAVADAARTCRDRDARELLRLKMRPAEVGRVVALHRAQMVRYKPADEAPRKTQITAEVAQVEDELTTLLALLDSGALEPVS
jgi:hypothetical protein